MKKALFNIALTFTVTVALFWVTGCGPTRMDSFNLNQTAQKYIKYDHYADASKLLEKSLEIDFENSPSHYWLGYCCEKQGQTSQAIWQYQLAIKFNPSLDIAQMALINLLQQQGQVDQSLQVARKYFSFLPADSRQLLHYEKYFLQQNMPLHAEIICDKAGKIAPHDAAAFVVMGDYYLQKNDKQKAIDFYSKGFKADPLYSQLATKLGQLGMRVSIPRPQPPRKLTPLERELKGLN